MTGISLKKKILFCFIISISTVLLTTVLLEMSLRVAALFVGLRPVTPYTGETKHVILCLGDSNTYGIYYSESESYPGQLQMILDKRAPGRYNVLNLGLPGMSSSQIAVRLPGWINQYHPQSVVVSVGINNYWNRSESETYWLYGLRLYRMIKLGLGGFPSHMQDTSRAVLKFISKNNEKYDLEIHDSKTGNLLIALEGATRDTRNDAQAVDLLQRDLTAMLALTKKHNIQLILLTYAAFPLPDRFTPRVFNKFISINEGMQVFGRQHGLTFVDVRNRFLELLSKGTPRAQYFASYTEAHPNPAGCLEIATLVANVFEPETEPSQYKSSDALKGIKEKPEATQVEKTYKFLDNVGSPDTIIEKSDYEKVDITKFIINNDWREALSEHPNSEVVFKDVPVMENAELKFGVGINQNAWDKSGDGVLFEITVVDKKSQKNVIFSRYIDPKNNVEDRKWFDINLSLKAFAGQKVSFIFKTTGGPKGDLNYDWAGWSSPQMILTGSEKKDCQ